MRNFILVLFVIGSFGLNAQDFEGSIKWAIKVQFKDTLRQQMMEQTKKAEAQREKRQLIERPVPDSLSADLPSETAGKENVGGGGIPTALVLTTKNKNVLAGFEGGRKVDFLYLNDQSKTYNIDHHRRSYHALPQQEKIPASAPWATAQFIKSEEIATVLEYNCTRYVRTFRHRNDDITQEVWVTTEIYGLDLKALDKVRINGHQIPFDKLDGVPLKVVVTNKEGTFSMVATRVIRSEVDDKVFSFPKGFKENNASNNAQR